MENQGDVELIWTEAKDVFFKQTLEEFKINNRRIPTAEEESEIWDRVFHMREVE